MHRLNNPDKEKIKLDIHTNASIIDFELTNNKGSILTPEDLKFLRVVADQKKLENSLIKEEILAFEGTADCLKNKLNAIWGKAIDYIKQTETEYNKYLLDSLIHIDSFYIKSNNSRDEELALSIPISKINQSKDIRAKEYLLTLRCIYRIKHIYEVWYKGGRATSDPFTNEFKEALFNDENFKSGRFINSIVQEFFTLTTHANDLGKACGIKLGVPLSEEIRNYRSTEAWKKQKALKALEVLSQIKESNKLNLDAKKAISVIDALEELEDIFNPFGEAVLEAQIREAIPKLNPNSNCKSIESIINDNKKLFNEILNDYKDGIGSPIEKGGRSLAFEPNLDTTGLVDLIKKWKLFSAFKKQIKNQDK